MRNVAIAPRLVSKTSLLPLTWLAWALAGILASGLLVSRCESLGAANAETPAALVEAGIAPSGSPAAPALAQEPALTAPAASDDGLVALLMTGKYLAAIGLVLTLLVGGVRVPLKLRWPWFGTKAGGYVLGFGGAAVIYFGAALRAGSGVSIGLCLSALAAGWAAAGGWESLRDVLGVLRKPAAAGVGVASLLIIVALSTASCRRGGDVVDHPVASTLIDCARADTSKIQELGLAMEPLVFGAVPDWGRVYDRAVTVGATIGGCAVALLVQDYLGGRRQVSVEDSWGARNTLERFRAEVAGGATFRTAKGDL
jgi:hypothetical protein